MRISGYYEYDDDSLRPGRHRDGGLHQNLFDHEGNLRASARFVPSDDLSHETRDQVFIPSEERGLSQSESVSVLDVFLLLALRVGVNVAISAGTAWWQERGQAHVGKLWSKALRSLRSRGSQRVPGGHEAGSDLAHHLALRRLPMSASEAKARLIAALAARAYADQQMRLGMDSEVAGDLTMEQLEHSLRELPDAELKLLLAKMVQDPTLMTEDALVAVAGAIELTVEATTADPEAEPRRGPDASSPEFQARAAVAPQPLSATDSFGR